MSSINEMTSSSSTSTSTQDLDQCQGLSVPSPAIVTPIYRSCGTSTQTEHETGPLSPETFTNPNSKLCGEFHFSFEEEDNNQFEEEAEATDNLLGRLRRGINIIEMHARETMADCYSEESAQDMEGRLEKSSLKMIKAEKSFMNTARIIAEVVDELSGEYEYVPEDKNGAEDDDKEEGVIFRKDMMKSASITGFRERINKIFGERMTTYQDGLTDDVLRGEKKFKDLQRQIRYGRRDAQRRSEIAVDAQPGGGGDVPEYVDGDLVEIREERRTAESEEEDEYDESILPSMDPISQAPILTAVSNKYCHHVFDRDSILGFIGANSEPKCPIDGCNNTETLQESHFVENQKLTEQVRAKNAKLYGPRYYARAADN